jgi:phage gp36-like protein
MAYHTRTDMVNKLTEEALVELTDDANSGIVDEAVLAAAASSAANIIDGYISSGYSLPLNPVPGILQEVSAGLAIHDLYRRRASGDMPKSVREDRDNAIRILEHIAEGKIKLTPIETQSTFLTNKTASDRDFSKTVLKRF